MRTGAQQKAALTRAINTGRYDKVRDEVVRAVGEWNDGTWLNGTGGKYGAVRPGAWPDGWALWQRALDDAAVKDGRGFFSGVDLRDL